jgi:aminoglycoside phosphotransferase (APT) family kinase protein
VTTLVPQPGSFEGLTSIREPLDTDDPPAAERDDGSGPRLPPLAGPRGWRSDRQVRCAERAELVLSHNDLGIEHVLVDPATLEVTGVVDWSDAAIVDPGARLRVAAPRSRPRGSQRCARRLRTD